MARRRPALASGRDHEEQNADDGDALQRQRRPAGRHFRCDRSVGAFVGVLIASEEAQRILRPPGEKADLQQFVRGGDQRDDAERVFVDDMGPDDHRDQLEQRPDDLRGQIEQGVSQQHAQAPSQRQSAGRGELPNGQQARRC